MGWAARQAHPALSAWWGSNYLRRRPVSTELLGINNQPLVRVPCRKDEIHTQGSAIAPVIRLLKQRLQQDLSDEVQARLSGLYLAGLEDLSETLLEFTSLANSAGWLASQE